MAKIKYDVTGVEPGQDFDTPVPVGLYMAKITELEETVSNSSGNEMLAVTLEIINSSEDKWNGRNLWDYIVLNDASAWKMRQLLEAVGLVKDGKEKGALDTDDQVGSIVQVRVRHDSSKEFGTRAKVGSLLPLPDDVDPYDLEEAQPAEPEETEGGGDEEELTWDELSAYGRPDMEALIEDNELDVNFNKRTNDDTLRERIAEELEIEQDDSEGGGEDDEEADYNSMTLKDLRTELKQRGLSPKGQKAAMVRKLKKDDADSGGDGEPF